MEGLSLRSKSKRTNCAFLRALLSLPLCRGTNGVVITITEMVLDLAKSFEKLLRRLWVTMQEICSSLWPNKPVLALTGSDTVGCLVFVAIIPFTFRPSTTMLPLPLK